ncbi:MAG TPA: GNAT family N-acetyltransferase [Verrucomicrobiae bacterium]|jgi:GNAT superfamily N-acetyltransferase|nr:GNAT family N-acetyltransferase [Verrucomicrobiae bacterium]
MQDNLMAVVIRQAALEMIPRLRILIAESARGLATGDYTSEQIEGALGSAWGVDSQLIRDGTYFVAEVVGAEDEIIACGGWSKRKTLFGADGQPGREPESLNPSIDSARIRAFFVHPNWARRGIGKMLLEKCEAEARAHGFRSAELVATLPGERFYGSRSYLEQSRRDYPLPNGCSILFITMRKDQL